MPTIEDNRSRWNYEYDWPSDGDEWSTPWGGAWSQWHFAILPRIRAFVPVRTILEIAPGRGRWTQFLAALCERLIVVDLSERCLKFCEQSFSHYSHIEYHVNDGMSLAMVENNSIDFVFSFDSLVHAERDVIKAYLDQLAQKMTPDAVGFVHHSNLGAHSTFLRRTAKLTIEEKEWLTKQGVGDDISRHWRAPSVTAAAFEQDALQAGLACASQEIVNWATIRLIDCFSTFTPVHSRWARPNIIIENPDFMKQAAMSAFLDKIYGPESFQEAPAPSPLVGTQPSGPLATLLSERDTLLAEKQREIEKLLNSKSWKITAPLRKLGALRTRLLNLWLYLNGVRKRISNGIILFYYEGIYARNILRTKPIICDTEGRFELHTLACERTLVNTLWSLKTFYHFCEIRPRLVIYDDGSLSEAAVKILSRHFVNCQLIRRDRFDQDMEDFLKAHRTSLEYSKIKSFYCALKLFGPMCYTKSEGVLYLDSDVLFFKKPGEMLKYMENGTPFYMSDYQDAYSHPVEVLNKLLKIELAHNVNAGLFYVAKRDFAGNMDLVESYFKKVSELDSKQHLVNLHEQTLAAILLSKANAARLSGDYQISRKLVTDKTVSHHFVNDGSRKDFYVAGLRRLKSAGFVKKLGCPQS
jgi:hypothetical protein